MLLLICGDREIVPYVVEADGAVFRLEVVDGVDDLSHDFSTRARVGRLRVAGILWKFGPLALEIGGLL